MPMQISGQEARKVSRAWPHFHANSSICSRSAESQSSLAHLPLFALDHIFMPMQISGQEARKVSRAWATFSCQFKYLVKKRGKSVALGHLPLFALDHIFMPMQISGQEARKVSRAWPHFHTNISIWSRSAESQSRLATYLFSHLTTFSCQCKYLVKKRGKSVALGHLPLFALDHIFMPMQISGQEATESQSRLATYLFSRLTTFSCQCKYLCALPLTSLCALPEMCASLPQLCAFPATM